MKRVTKVCFIALALVLIVAPLLACGGAETPPPETPGGNQAPVINSLIAESPTIIPNGETRINCDASDPDGDELTYTWTATSGTITATYDTFIFWQAPGFTGQFEVNVTVEDGQGGSAVRSCTITVLATQLPVIDSVTANPATLLPEETSTITCAAEDPDGDELTYTWSAAGGTLSGAGKIVTWQAPTVTGEFLINVLVDDGHDGVTEGSVRIVVEIPATTAILDPLPGESGTIYFDGLIIPEYKIGDTAANVGMQPFFSFDTTALTHAEIQEAVLIFVVKQIRNDIWTVIPSTLHIQCVEYGARSLIPADYHSVQVRAEIESLHNEPPGEVDVLVNVSQVAEWVEPRFQVRMVLGDDSNHNSIEDFIEFSSVELIVTYVK